MKRIIFDCDNTMGLYGKDVDDGLALLYLLGRKDVEIIGVTTTFGNSTVEKVYNNTVKMFNELSIRHIPLKKGATNAKNRQSEAAEFLVEMVNKFSQNITILATGSLANLYRAYEIDRDFFKKVKDIVLMGGITRPLIINGKIMNELNFSLDPLATYTVLSSGSKVTVLTGHICLKAAFGEREFNYLMENDFIENYRYIKSKSYDWYKCFTDYYNTKEFYIWDIVAAVYATNPELFADSIENVISTEEDLKTGFLKIDKSKNRGYRVNIPTAIKDKSKFNELIFEAWKNKHLY